MLFFVRRLSHLRTVRYLRTHYSLSVPHYTSRAEGRIGYIFSLACYRLYQAARRSQASSLLTCTSDNNQFSARMQSISMWAHNDNATWMDHSFTHHHRHLAPFRNVQNSEQDSPTPTKTGWKKIKFVIVSNTIRCVYVAYHPSWSKWNFQSVSLCPTKRQSQVLSIERFIV